jgi:hypothetical protein
VVSIAFAKHNVGTPEAIEKTHKLDKSVVLSSDENR